METGRLDASLLRALVPDTAAAARLFVPGQRVVARVLEATAERQFLLAFGDRRVLAQTTLPLVPGQHVALDVIRNAPTVELRLAQPTQPSSPGSDDRLAFAALLNAARSGAADAGRSAPPDGQALLRALAEAHGSARAPLTPEQAEALARALLPIPLATDRRALADAVREWLQNSGLLFEARLRAILTATPGLTADQALALLQRDLKALLGRLARASTPTSPDGDEPIADPAGGAATATGEQSPTPERVLAQQRALVAADLLARQAEFGLRWLADGVVRFELPVRLPSGDARAAIRFQREPDDPGASEASRVSRVTLRLTSHALGTVEASARWWGATLEAVFFVENGPVRERLEADLEAFTAALRTAFTTISAEVRVDPEHLIRGATSEPLPDLPGGSVISARA